MANKLIVGSPQAMAQEPSLEPPEPIESPPDLDKKILKMIEDSCDEHLEHKIPPFILP